MSLLFWQSLKGRLFLSTFLADEVGGAKAGEQSDAGAHGDLVSITVITRAVARQERGAVGTVVHLGALFGSTALEQTAVMRASETGHT